MKETEKKRKEKLKRHPLTRGGDMPAKSQLN